MRIGAITPFEYRQGELEYGSFIRGGIGWSHHQGPAMYPLADGRLLMLWSSYDIQECSNNALLLYSVSQDLGCTWSSPEVFMAEPGANIGAFLFPLWSSTKVLMFKRETRYVGYTEDRLRQECKAWADYGQSHTRILLRESADGSTWNVGRELDPVLIAPNHIPPFYGAPYSGMQLKSGRILIAATYLDPEQRNPQHIITTFLYSDDEGCTWNRSNSLIVPEPRGAMEPSFVELGSDDLYCIIRNKSGFLYESVSKDGGACWSRPTKTTIPSPESMARLLQLGNGHVILVHNNQSSKTQLPRHPLVVALSEDGCRHWSWRKIIATESGANQLSNFGVTQLTDGRILCALSHYHAIRPTTSDIDLAIFDEEWIRTERLSEDAG